jgi:hypothetical protein
MIKQKMRFIALLLSVIYFSNSTSTEDCKVLNLLTSIELRDGKLLETDTVIIQINTRSGEEFTNISLPYSKNLKISKINGWIEDINGNKIRELKNSEIKDKSEFSDLSFYEDNFIKTFQLKHNVYPYRIFYTYKTELNQFFSIVEWSPIINPLISTQDASLIVTLPKRFLYSQFLKDVIYLNTDTSETSVTLHYKSKSNAIEINEPYSVSYLDSIPKLIIKPIFFNYGLKGSCNTWEGLGNWYFQLNKGQLELPEAEKKAIDQIIKDKTDKYEIIKALYHYMQDHTRYINVSIGIGGYKSYPASYVSQNKFGDCKALSNYFMAILSYVGIKSNFVLIHRDSKIEKLNKEFPFLQFNHVFLAVPRENDTLWIENTENSEPFNYVGSSIQNRYALLVDEKNSKLIFVPSMKKEDVLVSRKFYVICNPDLSAISNIVFSYKGYQYEKFNSLNVNYNKTEQENIIKEYMPFNNYEVLEWKINEINRDTAKIELNSKVKFNKFLKKLGDDYYFNSFPINSFSLTHIKERKMPLTFYYPIYNIDTVIYTLPNDIEIKNLPNKKTIISKYGNYEYKVIYDSSKIIVVKKLEIFSNEYTLGKYSDFYEFYNSVKDAEKYVITLKRKHN